MTDGSDPPVRTCSTLILRSRGSSSQAWRVTKHPAAAAAVRVGKEAAATRMGGHQSGPSAPCVIGQLPPRLICCEWRLPLSSPTDEPAVFDSSTRDIERFLRMKSATRGEGGEGGAPRAAVTAKWFPSQRAHRAFNLSLTHR